MAAPETLITRTELETLYTAQTVNQLLSADGKKIASDDRVELILRMATGHVLGKVQVALELASIDTWWDASTTTERDKAELKRLTLLAAGYYMRHGGQRGEEVPEDARRSLKEMVDERITEIAEHHATIAANTQPATSTQNEAIWQHGIETSPYGSPRSRWSGF